MLCPIYITSFHIVDFHHPIVALLLLISGTSVIQVTATDADDANYGNSAKVVYSILQGQPYFAVDPETGENVY